METNPSELSRSSGVAERHRLILSTPAEDSPSLQRQTKIRNQPNKPPLPLGKLEGRDVVAGFSTDSIRSPGSDQDVQNKMKMYMENKNEKNLKILRSAFDSAVAKKSFRTEPKEAVELAQRLGMDVSIRRAVIGKWVQLKPLWLESEEAGKHWGAAEPLLLRQDLTPEAAEKAGNSLRRLADMLHLSTDRAAFNDFDERAGLSPGRLKGVFEELKILHPVL